MIYREQVWRKDNIAVTEIIPADGYELPPTFKRFRLRLAMQGFTHIGPITTAKDILLGAENIKDAMIEAGARQETDMKQLEAENIAEMNRVLKVEMEKIIAREKR